MMKTTSSKVNKNNSENPVREGTPNSIADDKERKKKRISLYDSEG